MTLSKTERSYQGPRRTKQGTYEVCIACPLLGDAGFVKGGKRTRCREEAYSECSQTLGEKTTPRISHSGYAKLPSGETLKWTRKDSKLRD